MSDKSPLTAVNNFTKAQQLLVNGTGEHITIVRLTAENGKGWDAVNLKTNRFIHVKSAAKLRMEIPDRLVNVLI